MYFAATLVRKRCGVESVSVFAWMLSNLRSIQDIDSQSTPWGGGQRQKHLKRLTYSTKVYSNFFVVQMFFSVFEAVWVCEKAEKLIPPV